MENIAMALEASETLDWKEIYELLLPRVFHFFFYKFGDTLTAEELSSITFEKAWAGRDHYSKNTGEFRFWLFGIAQKVAVDYFRKHKSEVPLNSIDIASNQNIEREVETKAEYERLAAVLSILSERERLLISLKYGAELTNREIARQVRLSESSVGIILFRAVAKLRKAWEE